MVSNLNSIMSAITPVTEELPDPSYEIEETRDNYGRFSVFPLDNGWGTTLGNALRRTLLHALPGAAATWVKIDNVSHEFSSIPHMREEVIEFLMNVKGIRIRSHANRPLRPRIEVSGIGEVKAGDIMAGGGEFEIVNPSHHLASLVHEEAVLSVEMNVENGWGFRQARHNKAESLPVGAMAVDAVFSPIRNAAYRIEQRRHMSRNDVECLILEIWTDGTRTPEEALTEALTQMRDTCHALLNKAGTSSGTGTSSVSASTYNTTITSLDLSARTQNSLARGGIDLVGQVLETPKEDLLKLRNFGEKSYNELFAKLESMGMIGSDDADSSASEGETEDDEA